MHVYRKYVNAGKKKRVPGYGASYESYEKYKP